MSRPRLDIRLLQRPLLFALGALLLINIGVWAAFVRPLVARYDGLTRDNNPRLVALRLRQQQVEGLEGFVRGLERAHADLRTLREDVLSTRSRRMIEVQGELDELCRRFDIDLNLVTYEHGVLEAEQLHVLRLTVPLEGGYAELRRFLQAVESSDKFLVIERVTLGQGKEGGAILALNITLATYFDAPELAPPAAGARRA